MPNPKRGGASPNTRCLLERLEPRQLLSCEPGDFGDDAAHAQAVGDHFAADGLFQTKSDVDWFKIQGKPGDTFSVRLIWDIDITFFDADLKEVTPFARRVNPYGEEILVLNSTRPYYARVSQSPTASNEQTGYHISFDKLPPDESSDQQVNATTIQLGQSIAARHAWGGDTDWFKFHAQAGHTYHIYTHTTSGLTYFKLAGANGEDLQYSNTTLLADDAIDWTAPADGDVYIMTHPSAYDAALDWPQPTTYRLSVYERPLPLQSQGIDDHGDINGSFSKPAEVDLLKFTPERGAFYSFEVEHNGIKTPIEMRLLDESGQLIQARNDNIELQTFDPKPTLLMLAPFDPSETGSYRLHIEKSNDDHPGWAGVAATPLSLGVPVSGSIQYENDEDAFSFSGNRNRSYRVTIHYPGWSNNNVFITGDGSGGYWTPTRTKDGAQYTISGAELYRISVDGKPGVSYKVQIDQVNPKAKHRAKPAKASKSGKTIQSPRATIWSMRRIERK